MNDGNRFLQGKHFQFRVMWYQSDFLIGRPPEMELANREIR